MPTSKRRPVDEARSRLQEKLLDVKSKSEQLHELINNVTSTAVKNAELALKETSKSKFLNKYGKSSQELESCLNCLLIISDAATREDDSTEEESNEEDDEEGDENQAYETESCFTEASTIATVTTANTYESNKTSLSAASTMKEETYLSVEQSPKTSLTNYEHGALSRHGSVDSIFSSVSMVTTPESSCMNRFLDENIIVEQYKWESDVPYPVTVTNIMTPWEFTIQLVDPDNDIMEQLCMKFMHEAANGYKGGINYVPPLGVYCCAKSPLDDTWYRAKVIEIQDRSRQESGVSPGVSYETMVKVRLIDEGFDALVTLTSIRPLEKKFASTPCQSFKCILGGVQPLAALNETKVLSYDECCKMWKSISIKWFQDIINSRNLFAAYLYYPPKSSYDLPHYVSKDVLVCDLYLNELDTEILWWKLSYNKPPIQHHLSFIMIVEQIAAHCSFFNSEINRKKSQKLISEKVKETIGGNIKCEIVEEQKLKVFPNHQPVRKAPEQKPVNQDPFQLQPKDNIRIEGTADIKPITNIEKKTSSKGMKTVKKVSNHVKKHESTKAYSSDEVSDLIDNEVRDEKDDKFTVATETEATNKKKLTTEVNDTRMQIQVNEIKQSKVKYTQYEFVESFTETKFKIDEPEGFTKIFVSEVVSPSLFYTHLVTKEAATRLDELMSDINLFYEDNGEDIRQYSKNVYSYKVGVAVVTRYSEDKKWYRGLIVAFNDELKFNILHVDFGSNEWTTDEHILPICKEFCQLPMETIPCCLADVQPLSRCVTKQRDCTFINRAAGDESDVDIMMDVDVSKTFTQWSERCISRFKTLVLTDLPLMAALKNSNKNSNGIYELYVYDTMGSEDVFINQLLVDEGMVISKVLSKQVPVVRLSEQQIEDTIKEENNMMTWDPMKEQYHSKRNVYSVNVDDPGVALLGYVDQKKEVCLNFARRGYCYRGDSCRYLHSKSDDPLSNTVEVFCNNNAADMPEIGDWVPITVTALFNPTHFWAQFPYGLQAMSNLRKPNQDEPYDELNMLNDRMNEHYSETSKREEKTDLTVLAEGELVGARFPDDNLWYRARVLSAADDLIQVCFIDYGNTEVVSDENVRKLIPDFLHLPHQAVECYLSEIHLEEDVEKKPEIFEYIRNKFRDLTADKVLIAHVIESSSSTKCMTVDLYDTSIHPNLHINQQLKSWNGLTYIKRTNPKTHISTISSINLLPG